MTNIVNNTPIFNKSNWFLFFVLLNLTWSFSAFSQTGPGGVGNSTSNPVWLRSGDLSSLSDGDRVPSWPDNSGNSNDFTQPTSTLQPFYITGQLNGMPVVSFNQGNDRLRKTGFSTFPSTAITAYIIHKNNGESNDATLSYASTGNNNDFLLFNSANVAIYRANQSRNTGTAINDNAWHICGAEWRSSDGDTRFYLDGSQTYNTNFQTGTTITSNGCLAIAAEQDAVDGGYDDTQDNNGDFAEIIVYNSYLNQAQRIIVENYLSSKYNIAISASGNDYYSYDIIHPYELAGIGRETAGDIHTAAMSAWILEISSPSGLDANNEYLLFGHDNASIASWTSTESPDAGAYIQRLPREWRFNETGETGTLTVTIDTTLLPARTSSQMKFVLLLDSDGDFGSGALVYEMCSPGSDQYFEVSGINITDGQYVAIGMINPLFEFSISSSYHFETNSNFAATIDVYTNYIACADVTVNFNVSPNTATSPSDFILPAGSVTVPAGSSSGSINLTIVGDVAPENTEDFSVSLLDGLGMPYSSHTVVIYDNDNTPKIQFNTSTSTHAESSGTVNITVIRTGDNSLVSSCDYRLRIAGGPGTATQGDDFNFTGGTVTFNIGENTKQFPLDILEDGIYENGETVIFELYNVSAGTDLVSGGTEHEATITDNDLPPEIQFSTTASSGDEGASPVEVQVELASLSQADADVDYLVTGGSATGSGTDYTLAAGTLTITSGNLTGEISISITDDLLQELPETIEIRLRNPSNASLGDDTIFVYTIEDNDQIGFEGPGGIGNSSTNILWLSADIITGLSDGADVTSWTDRSGNSNGVAQSNTTYTPRFYSGIVNGWPVVRFEQADTRFRKTNFTNFPTSEITAIYVNYTNDNGDGVLSYASSASDNEFLIYNNSNLAIYRGASGNRTTGAAGNGSTWRIMGATWNSVDGNTKYYRNGTQSYSTNNFGTGTSMTQGGCFAIGGEQDAVDGGYAAAQSHQGDIPEVILYNSVLNSAQRIILENYLSSKYGIIIANDYYTYDGAYGFELAGIGRVDANNFHIDAKGPAIMRINNPSDLGNNEFLLWGHDNAATTTPNTTDIPAGIDNRLNRVWRVDETGDAGTVRIYFYLQDYTIGEPDSLVILIDTDDGSFTNASIYNAGLSYDPVNKIVSFSNVNLSDGNWFTVASKSESNPLPVNFLSFSASVEDNSVILEWITASEINCNRYIIERSIDGLRFSAIGTSSCAGNSNEIRVYKYKDDNPVTGLSYYRLRQYDNDGRYCFSELVSVQMNPAIEKSIEIFPNPIYESILYVRYNNMEENCKCKLLIYNSLGNMIMVNETLLQSSSGVLSMNLPEELSPGVYYLVFLSDSGKYVRKLILRPD